MHDSLLQLRQWRGRPSDHPWIAEHARHLEHSDKVSQTALLEATWELGTNVSRALGAHLKLRQSTAHSPLLLIAAARAMPQESLDPFPGRRLTGSPADELKNLHGAMREIQEIQLSTVQSLNPERVQRLAMSVHSASVQLIAALMPETTERPPDIDVGRAYQVLDEELRNDTSVQETMSRTIRRLSQLANAGEWDKVEALDFSGEIARYRDFAANLIRIQPPPFMIDGLWYEVTRPSRDGLVTLDVLLGGAAGYKPNDPDWPDEPLWRPAGGFLLSPIMADLYDMGYRSGSLGVGSDFVGLAHTCLLAHELTLSAKKELETHHVGAAASLSGAEPIHLGWV